MTNMEQILPKIISRIYDSRCRLFSKTFEGMDGARLPETYQNLVILIFCSRNCFLHHRILFLNRENHQMEPKFSSATKNRMPSGITAKLVAENIIEKYQKMKLLHRIVVL